jgi:small subunit ribosomal protein S21
MIIINKEHGDSIDRMLKRYKKKSIQYKVIDELKERKTFTKPSVKKREKVLKAIFRQKVKSSREKDS